MQLFVIYKGIQHEIDVEDSWTVLDLKRKIQEKLKINPYMQILHNCGTRLIDDETTLYDLHIGEEEIIDLTKNNECKLCTCRIV